MKLNIKTIEKKLCPICGENGAVLYAGLQDQLFGTPGKWSFKRCTKDSCGLLWLDPCPIEDDIPKAYETYYTHGSLQKKSLLKSHLVGFMRNFFVIVLDGFLGQRRDRKGISHLYLNDMSPGRVLDIGCGDAVFLSRMKGLGWNVEGLDFDANAAANAKALFDIDVHVGRLEDLKFPTATFDAVTMNHVIEHVYDPVALLREIRRILKPGGRLVSVTPNARSMGHRVYGQFWRGLEPPRHIHIFTPSALNAITQSAGLGVSKLFTTSINAWIILSATLALKRLNNSQEYGGAKASRLEQMQGFKMHIVEALELNRSPTDGEEIVLIAQNQDTPPLS
jgi:2-polyprenyl-3-methyl-5-hydroxy-6-metoxy-1,4-benzoquinol methylase